MTDPHKNVHISGFHDIATSIFFFYNVFTQESTDKHKADARLEERRQEKHMVVWL
jgi:hypothetical protein